MRADQGTYADMLMTNIEDPDDGNGGDALNVDIGAGGMNLIGDGQWHTYTLTVESGVGSKVYIDGVLGNSSARGADGINPGTDLILGANTHPSTARFYGGELDSVLVYDMALERNGCGRPACGDFKHDRALHGNGQHYGDTCGTGDGRREHRPG